MAFQKGVSGNPKGRPKMRDDEKEQREEFKALLRSATIPALTAIIEIANSKCNKDRFAAAKFIVEKSYGSNVAFLSNGVEDIEPVRITVVPYHKEDEAEDDEWGEDDPDDEWEE